MTTLPFPGQPAETPAPAPQPEDPQAKIAEIKANLEARKPHFEEGLKKGQEAIAEANDTIAMLQRRTKEQYADLELEGGDTIRIYSRMSKSDERKIGDIEEERLGYVREAERMILELRKAAVAENPITSAQIAKMQSKIDGIFDRAQDCWLKIIAIITVDPAISYEWLKENPDKYSPEDIVDAYLGYKEARKYQIAQRAERVKRAISFRKDPAGERIHPTPTLDGDKGSA
jgi:hypothetical protein